MAASPMPIETIRTRVGTSPSRTKPVRKVPVMAPTVPTADSRPDDRAARRDIGQRAADEHRRRRRQDGRRHDERGRREDDDPDQPLPQPDAADHPDDRHRGDGAEATEDERGAEERQRTDGVRGPPADPGTERDAGQDRADDPGVGRERDADVRRQEPPGGDLEDEHARRGDERQEAATSGGRGGAGAYRSRSSIREW